MRKTWFKYLCLVALMIVVIGLVFWWRTDHTAQETVKTPETSQTTKPAEPKVAKTQTNPYGLVAPIADFRTRITKKFFGTYVSPGHSPVSPERFQGYHTGVDVEYGDIKTDVPVHAIAAGNVVYSGWVSGYGGVEILHHKIDGKIHSVVYGHLRPSSLLAVGTKVKQNQQIGLLGTAHSHETDGERRHLHFAILASDEINLRGYANDKAELSTWVDPLKFYPKT
jgi:murein DD-endopeptidase MepM/ murein hydrolase activator NlpD